MESATRTDTLTRRIGELVHNWGFKRIHGRIWARLFLSSRPLDAADLIEQLGISKALVSVSLHELFDLKAIEEVGRSSRATNLYRANHDLHAIYVEVLKSRERRMLELASSAVTHLASLETVELESADVSRSQIAALALHLQSALSLVNNQVPILEPINVGLSHKHPHKVPDQLPDKLPSFNSLMDLNDEVVLPARGG